MIEEEDLSLLTKAMAEHLSQLFVHALSMPAPLGDCYLPHDLGNYRNEYVRNADVGLVRSAILVGDQATNSLWNA